MAVEGERFIKPADVIRRASGPGAKVSVKALRKHGEGLVVQYTIRYAYGDQGWSPPEYRVCIINSRGHFAGSLLIQ
jgi:hypothetical protein